MQIVRRVYVYFIAAVSLTVLAVGVANLLQLAFDQIWEALGGTSVLVGDADSLRQQLSLYIALTVVALPIWLVHWWLAERALLRPGAEGEAERRSGIRALYLALGLIVPIGFGASESYELLFRLFGRLFDARLEATTNVPTSLAILIVVGAVWTYHVRVRRQDMAVGPLEGKAAWLPRLYLYAAAALGAILLLFAVRDLINVVFDLIFRQRAIVEGERWWAEPLASDTARIIVGLILWAAHWGYSLRLLEAGDWRGASERRASLRRVYMYVGIAGSVLAMLVGLSMGLEAVLREILSVPPADVSTEFAQRLLAPPLSVVPFALLWLYHSRQVTGEARRFGDDATRATIRRLSTYVVALVGLVAASIGLAYVLGIVLDFLLGGTRTTLVHGADWWREQVSIFAPYALFGAAVWVWPWYRAEASLTIDPRVERQATSRRVYLYVVLASTVVAILGGLAYAIYRILAVILDVIPSDRLISDISISVGILLVAGALFAYHGTVLRQDMAARPEEAEKEETLPLVISGPAGADFNAVLAELRRHLPERFSLRPGKARE